MAEKPGKDSGTVEPAGDDDAAGGAAAGKDKKPKEIGGPKGPEPTRYGDWERKGIVSDF